MKTKCVSLLLFLALLAGVAGLPRRAAAQCDSCGYQAGMYTPTEGADSLPYRLLTPDTVELGRRYPLVLFLHGAGERGLDNRAQLLHGGALFADSANRHRFPAYVLFPQCPTDEFWPAVLRTDHFGRGNNPFPESGYRMSRALRLAEGLLEQTIARYPVDTTRVYVVGLSMGGMGVLDLVCRRPERFAAAVAICGGVNVHRLEVLRTRTRFRLIHGDADPVVPVRFSREAAAALRRAGAEVEYIELPGVGHGSWYAAFRRTDFLPWLFGGEKGFNGK